MESEQLIKLQEDIRVELSRGNYQMDKDELPYSGTAQRVAADLWNRGWRPEKAKSSIYRDLRDREMHRWATLRGVQTELKEEIEVSYELFPTEAEQEAYVAGLNAALVAIKARDLESQAAIDHWENKEIDALQAEGYSE